MQKPHAEILRAIAQKPPRSKLEPHYELIRELRRRSRTYREIAKILHDHVGLQVDHTTIYDFVRLRARRSKSPRFVEQLPPRHPLEGEKPFRPQEPSTLATSSPRSTRPEDTADAYARIERLKRRKIVPGAKNHTPAFHYDESAPLRLVSETEKDNR